jgi:circadian clock protein KaiC
VKGATVYGEPSVLMSFEERADDLVDNVSSLGYDLCLLKKSFCASRLTANRPQVSQSNSAGSVFPIGEQ